MSNVSWALTTPTLVKQRLQNVAASANDALIDTLIDAATDWIESMCSRRFLKTTYTQELHNGYGRNRQMKTQVFLKQYPVLTLTSFQYKTGSNSWTDFATTDYFTDLKSGIIKMSYGYLPLDYQNVRATYDAGYLIDFAHVTDPTLHTLPRDLTLAATKLVVRELKKRETVGVDMLSPGGDTIRFLNDIDADIMGIIQDYVRIDFDV